MMTAHIRCADQLDQDQRLKASVEPIMRIYSCDIPASPHEEDKVGARAHQSCGIRND
jgi:hypothetical protein